MNNYSIKECIYEGRVGPQVGSGRVRLFVGNRRSCRVGSTLRRVGSGPRKVTRGQLCAVMVDSETDKPTTSQDTSSRQMNI